MNSLFYSQHTSLIALIKPSVLLGSCFFSGVCWIAIYSSLIPITAGNAIASDLLD